MFAEDQAEDLDNYQNFDQSGDNISFIVSLIRKDPSVEIISVVAAILLQTEYYKIKNANNFVDNGLIKDLTKLAIALKARIKISDKYTENSNLHRYLRLIEDNEIIINSLASPYYSSVTSNAKNKLDKSEEEFKSALEETIKSLNCTDLKICHTVRRLLGHTKYLLNREIEDACQKLVEDQVKLMSDLPLSRSGVGAFEDTITSRHDFTNRSAEFRSNLARYLTIMHAFNILDEILLESMQHEPLTTLEEINVLSPFTRVRNL